MEMNEGMGFLVLVMMAAVVALDLRLRRGLGHGGGPGRGHMMTTGDEGEAGESTGAAERAAESTGSLDKAEERTHCGCPLAHVWRNEGPWHEKDCSRWMSFREWRGEEPEG